VLAAINDKFTGQVAEGNAAAARAAFDFVRDEQEALRARPAARSDAYGRVRPT
jgi:Pyruvate/2-oxoacid:ferredoxin oxidoreductase gamma subunit